MAALTAMVSAPLGPAGRSRVGACCVPVVLTVLASGVVGCRFDDQPPDGAVIVCLGDQDCPSGQACDDIAHECRAPGAETDGAAPTITSASFEPPFAADGLVELVVVADEALATDQAPALIFDGVVDPGFSAAEVAGATAIWRLDAGAAGEGAYPIRGVALSDQDGARALRLTPELTLVIDRAAPSVLELRITHGNAAAAEAGLPFSAQPGTNQILVTFTVDEGIEGVEGGGVVVEAGGLSTPSEVVCERGTANDFSCTATVTAAAFADGGDRVGVTAVDRAGNATAITAAIETDLTGPQLIDAPVVTLRTAGGTEVNTAVEGSSITVELITDEALADAGAQLPQLSIAGDASFAATSARALSTQRWQLTATFAQVGEGDGTAVVSATLFDVLGNRAEHEVASFTIGEGVTSPCAPIIAAACVDFDGDGAALRSGDCAGGTDCDDTDPLVGDGIEIPGDGVDNGCSGAGDTPIDEDSGVFVDASAAPGGAGTRTDPAATLAAADALLDGRGWLFLAGDRSYLVEGEQLGAASMLGGLAPGSWQRDGSRSEVELTMLTTSTAAPVLERIDVAAPDYGYQLQAEALVLIGSSTSRVVLYAPRLGLFRGSYIERTELTGGFGAGGESLVHDSIIGGCVDVHPGSTLRVLSGLADDFGCGDFEHFSLYAGARLEAVNSQLGSIACHECGSVEVRHSVLSSPGPFVVAIDPGSGPVALWNDVIVFRQSSSVDPAAITGDESTLTLRSNLFDVAVPGAPLLAATNGAGDIAGAAALNLCPTCADTAGNIEATALFEPDMLHLDALSPAIGAGSNVGDTEVPVAAAADVDGDCRASGVVDIGPDQR